jgi:hypothetical protein
MWWLSLHTVANWAKLSIVIPLTNLRSSLHPHLSAIIRRYLTTARHRGQESGAEAVCASRSDTQTLDAEFHLERTLDHGTIVYPNEGNPGIQWRLASYRHCKDKQQY